MTARLDDRQVIIRNPASQGAIIFKIGGLSRSLVPEEITNHDELVIQSVPDASALTDHEIDYEALKELSDDLKNTLREHGYLASQ